MAILTGCACVLVCNFALTLQIDGESTEMSTVHGVIHTYIVCVYEFRRGFCTSVLSLYMLWEYTILCTSTVVFDFTLSRPIPCTQMTGQPEQLCSSEKCV